jgi:hypothetical protein
MAKHKLSDDVAQILIDEKRLQARIRELAAEIEADYQNNEDLLLICVLKGAFVFLADISRMLGRPHQVDFMGVSSYGAGTQSSGAVRIDRSQGGASAAAELGADAFTSGDTIVMPSSHGPLDRGRGQALLAHELVHVGQQRSMGSSLPAEHTAAGQDLEREAQSAEVSVEQGHRSGPPAAALPLAHRGTLQASVETSSASHSGHARRASSVAMAAAGPGAGAGDSASYHLQASHIPPQQTVPAPQRSALSSTSSGTAGTASAAGPDAHDDIDEVSRRVYERIRLRLRRELLLDRERGGYLTDPR